MERNQPKQPEQPDPAHGSPQQPQQTPDRTVQEGGGGPKGFMGAVIVTGLVALLVGFAGGWAAAETSGTAVLTDPPQETEDSQRTHESQLEVPANAEVISECAKGRGKQYVLPENIPQGPVFGVWNGEITSVEYMLGKEEFLGGEDFTNMDLMDARYDHIDVGLLSEGHAGYPEPHYHVDLYTIPRQQSQQITCE